MVRAYVCDVSDEERVVGTFAAINDDFGAIHGLVNNAGILRDAQLIKVKDGKVIKKMTGEHYSLVVDIHMKGAFLCAREAASYMVEGGGRAVWKMAVWLICRLLALLVTLGRVNSACSLNR